MCDKATCTPTCANYKKSTERFPYVMWQGEVSGSTRRIVRTSPDTIIVEGHAGNDALGNVQWGLVTYTNDKETVLRAYFDLYDKGQ